MRKGLCGAVFMTPKNRSKKHLSNAASNLEHMSFSDISVTHMEVRGESASGLKSLDMQREGGVRGHADAEERGGHADGEERGGFALQATQSKARDVKTVVTAYNEGSLTPRSECLNVTTNARPSPVLRVS